MKKNFEEFLENIKDMLQNEVADYLDVNRQHISIVFLGTEIIGEDCIDWDADPDDLMEGTESETYYQFAYAYKKDKRRCDYEEPVDMVWQHTNGVDRTFDRVMSNDEFEELFESKKHNICSMLWYEGENK